MRFLNRSAVLPIFLCLLLAGCGGNSSQDSSKNESPQPQAASAQQQAPPPTPAQEPAAPPSKSGTPAPSKSGAMPPSKQPQTPPAPAEQKPAPSPAAPAEVQRPVQTEVPKAAALPAEPPKLPTMPQAAPAKQAAALATKVLPKDILILTGSPLGAVKFFHKLHSETRHINCEICHHASKPEKPAAAPQRACSTCHTTVAVPPMKTKLQAAFHSPTATSGTCIDCHKAQNAAGKAAPVKCLDCHKKSNV